MRRIGNIYDKICSPENLYLAYQKAKKGKGKTYGVILYERNLQENLTRLQKELVEMTYKTSVYSVFMIQDPKERLVYRLPFRDRIVHHAIMNILEPIWVSVFTTDSYSCIKGRGIHGVLKNLKRDLKDFGCTQYCLKLDIKKFYPSIDHSILKGIIRRKIKDNKVLQLLDGIIDSAPGVPIGNYLSQFLANLYLTYFDHWIKEILRVKYYYRYADDIVILASEKGYLHTLFLEIRDYLQQELKLEVKHNYQVFPVDVRGIDFVGYVFRHTHILMRKSIKQRFCRKASRLTKSKISSKEYAKCISPWLGWAKHCNSKNLINKVITRNEKVC